MAIFTDKGLDDELVGLAGEAFKLDVLIQESGPVKALALKEDERRCFANRLDLANGPGELCDAAVTVNNLDFVVLANVDAVKRAVEVGLIVPGFLASLDEES